MRRHRRVWPVVLAVQLGVLLAALDATIVGTAMPTVIVDGRVVVDAYRQTFVDEPRLYSKVQEIGENLLARTGVTPGRPRWPIV